MSMYFPPPDSDRLRWTRMGQYLKPMTDDDKRVTIAQIAIALVGFGSRDDPPGRQLAYQDILGPGDTPNMRRSMLGMWSCGLTAACVWRCAGVRHALRPPYRIGTAIDRLAHLAASQGGLNGGNAFQCRIKQGDTICIGAAGPQRKRFGTDAEYWAARARWLERWGGDAHVFVVTNVIGTLAYTVEGGKRDEPTGICIKASEREIRIVNGRVWAGDKAVNWQVPATGVPLESDAEWVLPEPVLH